MHQTDKIKELARELNIDYGSSSHEADQLRMIANQLGMENFNSIHDVDKLEECNFVPMLSGVNNAL